MPELLKLKTPEWSLSIWCSDITKRQQAYQRTMAARGQYHTAGCELRFSAPIKIESLESSAADIVAYSPPETFQVIALPSLIFFENMQYQFEWVFNCHTVGGAATEHKLKSINDSFRFVASKTGHDLPRLTGVINTGNDIGWLRLPWCFELHGVPQSMAMSFEVLPVKMDLHTDLPAMYRSIDAEFPLWRFSFAQKTEQSVARSKARGNFPLLWLAHFESLRNKFADGLKIIANAPHSRLQQVERHVKAERLKGKMSNKLTERVTTDLNQHIDHKHYKQNKKILSVNTPENQFIKMIVDTARQQLADFHKKLIVNNQAPDKQRISDSFLYAIEQWQKPLLKMQIHSFLREVDKFTGKYSESLVLQQKTGYCAVYKIWQELKFYLDVFAGQPRVSMKAVADIYEIWCFLELRRILVDQLGFEESQREKKRMRLEDFEYQLTDGFSGAFHFKRKDGVIIRLAHEPVFRKSSKTIKTFWVTQKPDILIEVTFPNEKKCIWLFDAKYRIKSPDLIEDLDSSEDYGDAECIDYVPEDALNQMHRYRDALIHINTDDSKAEIKSRPIFGAFALYPGFFTQLTEINPYAEVIEQTGIGAFALLPAADSQSGSEWLCQYLKAQIGMPVTEYAANKSSEMLFIQESARIPYYGMQQALYPDLVLTAALGGKAGKKLEYFQAFENGSAEFYHTKALTFNSKYKHHVIHELKFLAIAINSSTDRHTKIIQWIWPIKNIELIPRNQITEAQAGSQSSDTENYYLFKLGKPFRLKDSITRVPHTPIKNTFRLTTLSLIENASEFSDILRVYEDALFT